MEIKIKLAAAIESALNQPVLPADIDAAPDLSLGDFAFPCFKYAKQLRMAPAKIAEQLAGSIALPPEVERAAAVGPYLNFFLDRRAFASDILPKAAAPGYGCSRVNAGKTVLVDYSSPNIAKNFHVGHLRSTVIGAALKRIYEATGAKVIGINHLGDWGTQFGKLIVGFKRWSSRELVDEGGIDELTRVYVKFHNEAEANPPLEDEARAWLVRLQQGDPEATELWKIFRDLSLAEFDRVYKRLGTTFEYIAGESFYNDKMDTVVDELRDSGLLELSDGASVVRLDEQNMPPCLILRSDGGTLYPTRDISAALYRQNESPPSFELR